MNKKIIIYSEPRGNYFLEDIRRKNKIGKYAEEPETKIDGKEETEKSSVTNEH